MAEPGLVEEYLTLGLRLGRHIDGMVDAYYGPPERAVSEGGRRDVCLFRGACKRLHHHDRPQTTDAM